MSYLLRAVGTPYEMSDILRTYGTLYSMYPIFYPYTIPNGMILKDYTQFLKMSMNNAGKNPVAKKKSFFKMLAEIPNFARKFV